MEQAVDILHKIHDVLLEIRDVLADFEFAYLEDEDDGECEDEPEAA